MKNLLNKAIGSIMGVALVAASMMGMTGCSVINDDLDPCPQGVKLRFVFDYNMEFYNTFPAQVDCLTLFVYDRDGKFVTSRTETTSVLADENYRMTLDLPADTYHFVAYGGMECDKSTFHFVKTPAAGTTLAELQVNMDDNCVSADPGEELHPLFFGDLDLTIDPKAMDYTDATVYMIRDTNTIRVVLQNVDGTPVNPDDFTFTIFDDNTQLAFDNSVIPVADGNTYSPWQTGQVTVGTTDTDDAATIAFAEFSTSRLMDGSGSRLVVNDCISNEAVLSIPLVNYLQLMKSVSSKYSKLGAQEFLDRECDWTLMLFLDNGRWIDTHIVINDWTVRLNHAEL